LDTGQTWLEVLNTAPSGGNAYYILAHQVIAAYLNSIKTENAAWAPGFDEKLADAWELLEEYDDRYDEPVIPAGDDYAFPGGDDDRTYALALAEWFDDFNNGYLAPEGPIHCDE
jgi:hypothetical protein